MDSKITTIPRVRIKLRRSSGIEGDSMGKAKPFPSNSQHFAYEQPLKPPAPPPPRKPRNEASSPECVRNSAPRNSGGSRSRSRSRSGRDQGRKSDRRDGSAIKRAPAHSSIPQSRNKTRAPPPKLKPQRQRKSNNDYPLDPKHIPEREQNIPGRRANDGTPGDASISSTAAITFPYGQIERIVQETMAECKRLEKQENNNKRSSARPSFVPPPPPPRRRSDSSEWGGSQHQRSVCSDPIPSQYHAQRRVSSRMSARRHGSYTSPSSSKVPISRRLSMSAIDTGCDGYESQQLGLPFDGSSDRSSLTNAARSPRKGTDRSYTSRKSNDSLMSSFTSESSCKSKHSIQIEILENELSSLTFHQENIEGRENQTENNSNCGSGKQNMRKSRSTVSFATEHTEITRASTPSSFITQSSDGSGVKNSTINDSVRPTSRQGHSNNPVRRRNSSMY